MSIGYRLHPETGLALLRSGGTFTLDEWERSAYDALQSMGTPDIRRMLSDRRKMPGGYPKGIEDRAVAFFRKHAQILGDVRWAVVLPDDLGNVATVRLAAELSKGTRVRLREFPDLPGALRWLLGAYEEEQVEELVRWIESDE